MSLDRKHTTAPGGKVKFEELVTLTADTVATATVNTARIDITIVE